MATDEQVKEIQAALTAARAAQDNGENAQALFAKAEQLMTKYGMANEPHLDDAGNP